MPSIIIIIIMPCTTLAKLEKLRQKFLLKCVDMGKIDSSRILQSLYFNGYAVGAK